MKNTENTTVPAGYSRASLRDALREVADRRHKSLTLSVERGWYACPSALVDADEWDILDYEGLLAATPNESPEDYTEETFEGLAEWIESHVEEWVWEAFDWERIEEEEACMATLEQRPVNPDATSERLEALRTILANLKRA
jgi:hypothetical protein